VNVLDGPLLLWIGLKGGGRSFPGDGHPNRSIAEYRSIAELPDEVPGG